MNTPGVIVAVAVLMLSGCARFGKPFIRSGETTVTGLKDAGSPATLNTSEAGERLALPKGSRIWLRQTDRVPARPATENAPESKEQPAETVTVIEPGDATFWERTTSSVTAGTGTVDTTVAKHRIDAQERRWLLWTALACGLAGLVVRSLLPAWPALSNGLLIASPIAFAAWKLADVPSWLWLVALGIVALLALGYKRAEWDRDGDGIPDVFQKRKP
jgi:hypothetical protein